MIMFLIHINIRKFLHPPPNLLIHLWRIYKNTPYFGNTFPKTYFYWKKSIFGNALSKTQKKGVFGDAFPKTPPFLSFRICIFENIPFLGEGVCSHIRNIPRPNWSWNVSEIHFRKNSIIIKKLKSRWINTINRYKIKVNQ